MLIATLTTGALCLASATESFNLNETFFGSLENYQVNAIKVPEEKYPWIARVVHSASRDTPHVCTASCVSQRIFITAARCIYGLNVKYTTIIYQSARLRPRAFVFPSNGSKQAFDDIGLVVTEPYQVAWSTVRVYEGTRSDDGFQWFADLPLNGKEFKVVGYATQKGIHKIKDPARVFDLTELQVAVSIDVCTTILTFDHHIQGFHVPCYQSCSLEDYNNNMPTCKNYHGAEGGAVIDTNTDELLGVATWGAYFRQYELPVGFAVPNSDNFFEDFKCARRIRDDESVFVTPGHYQMLCQIITK